MSAETVKSTIKAIMRDGLSALQDRRRRHSQPSSPICPQLPPITLIQQDQIIVVDLGSPDRQIKIDKHDALQRKIVLLTMLNSGLLSKEQVAEAIGLTQPHTAALARQLTEKGALSLADQRKGQMHDYRVSPQIKAELIQQFAVEAVTGGATSGTSISDQLKERCQITISPRTVRHHLHKLGLSKIKHSLPELIAAVKKTSKAATSG
jgi:transposase